MEATWGSAHQAIKFKLAAHLAITIYGNETPISHD